jgi:hypothetical protein
MEYKELQNLFKKIAQKSALDQFYRDLCLKDAQAAMREAGGQSVGIPEQIIFLEEDRDCLEHSNRVFVLPPLIKKSWLWDQKEE